MIRIASVCLTFYWLGIFTLTHLPKSSLPAITWSDKVCHALAYSGLAFLIAWALPVRNGRWVANLAIAVALGMIYGGLDEFTQNFIPGRACEFLDFSADCLGVVLGISAYVICRSTLVQLSWGRNLIRALSR